MIDPRALQQHFKKVNQKIEPKKVPVPRVPEPTPLISIQAIPVPEPVKKPEIIKPTVDTFLLQEELKEVTQALATLKQSLSEVSKIEPVTVTVPVSVVIKEEPVITEVKPIVVEEVKKEEDTPYGYSIPKKRESEEYNPYGYYSGPMF